MDVSVVIATFGEEQWRFLAQRRAVPSVESLGVPVILTHAATLADARNEGLAQVDTEWVCHLDADDQLEAGYFDRMAERSEDLDVIAPSVRYVRHHWTGGPSFMPRVPGHDHRCEAACLVEGNWLVVGAVARAATLRSVGGWREWPMFEDWDLWLRCHLAGAAIGAAPRAVYKAWTRRGSRNRSPSAETCARVHADIVASLGLPTRQEPAEL